MTSTTIEFYYIPFPAWATGVGFTDEPVATTEKMDSNEGGRSMVRDWLQDSPKRAN